MNYRSLAFRLGALYTLLLSATFALVGTGTFYGLQQYLRSNLRDSLSRRSTQVEQILMQAPVDATEDPFLRAECRQRPSSDPDPPDPPVTSDPAGGAAAEYAVADVERWAQFVLCTCGADRDSHSPVEGWSR